MLSARVKKNKRELPLAIKGKVRLVVTPSNIRIAKVYDFKREKALTSNHSLSKHKHPDMSCSHIM